MTTRLHPWQRASMSPMERTLAWMREHGWRCVVVERWIKGAGIRRDAWGCDLLTCHEEHGVRLVQVCDGSSFAGHVDKVESNDGARAFVRAGGSVRVVGWRQLKAAGGWTPRVWSLRQDRELDLEEVLENVEWQPRMIA